LSFCTDKPGGCVLALRVHPGARRNAVTGTHDNALKISLTTPPTDGRANEALIRFLADLLGVPKASIALLSGAASRSKSVAIVGLSAAEVEAMLDPVEEC